MRTRGGFSTSARRHFDRDLYSESFVRFIARATWRVMREKERPREEPVSPDAREGANTSGVKKGGGREGVDVRGSR